MGTERSGRADQKINNGGFVVVWVEFVGPAAVVLNWRGATSVTAYVLLGIVLWVAVLKSGVHATLAGVLIALCIPLRDRNGHATLKDLEHDLLGPVAFGILPLFAFANAGISFAGIGWGDLVNPVTLGIALGLFLGNPIAFSVWSGCSG